VILQPAETDFWGTFYRSKLESLRRKARKLDRIECGRILRQIHIKGFLIVQTRLLRGIALEMGRGSHVLKLAVLECERLQDHLAPAVFDRTGGYLQLLHKAFTHVTTHASTLLHPQITVPPSLSFTG